MICSSFVCVIFALVHNHSTTLASKLLLLTWLEVCRLSSAFCREALSWLPGAYATFQKLLFEWVYIAAGLWLTVCETGHGLVVVNFCRPLRV